MVVGASSDEHLWFVVEQPGPRQDRLVLRHHARAMDGPYYGAGMPLTQMPAAMAAWGSQLWLVFAPQRREERRRETFTVQVDRNPALGSYYFTPHDRLRVVESLPGLGKLAGFVGTADGPVALLQPTQRAEAGVRTGDAQAEVEPLLTEARLLQLRGGRWTDLPLPQGFRAGRNCRLGAGGAQGQILVILTDDRMGPDVDVYWRDEAGAWDSQPATIDLPRVDEVTRVGVNIALLTQSRAGQDRVEVAYLRPRLLLSLGGFTTSAGRWVGLGLRDGLRVIEQRGRGELTMRRIDAATGQVGLPQAMTTQPLMTARLLHRPILFALAVTGVLFLLLIRPDPKTSAVKLPAELVVQPPLGRLLAVGVDLLIGAAAAVLLLGCRFADVLQYPLWTPDLADAAPCLTMIGVTVAHSTLSELIWSRTAGKALVGARVAARDGSRPTSAAIAWRNSFKALVLVIPVLAVFALMNPNLQGLGDLVARTVVVRRAPGPNPPDLKDR